MGHRQAMRRGGGGVVCKSKVGSKRNSPVWDAGHGTANTQWMVDSEGGGMVRSG